MAHPLELLNVLQYGRLLLLDGHSTLFAWILAEAPHAELDNGSQRTAERLQSKGLLP
jgi:hypothetical protein